MRPSRVACRRQFSHNQVQQACYELVPPGYAHDMRHLRIGRLIRDSYAAKLDQSNWWDSDDKLPDTTMLFLAVEHLNKASHHFKEEQERIGLVELNLMASFTAEKSGSFHSAAKYLAHARNLLQTSDSPCFDTYVVERVKASKLAARLGDEVMNVSLSFRRLKHANDDEHNDDWNSHRRLTLEVYNASAEIERACGDFDKALDMATAVACRVDGLEALRATRVIVDCLGVQTRLTEAIYEAKRALDLVGEGLPPRFGRLRIWTETAKLKRLLKQFSREGLLSLPEMRTPEKREAIQLLNSVYRFAWETENEALLTGVCLRLMRVTLKYGQCKWTPFVYATFAMMLSSFGDVALGRTFLNLSEDLVAKRGESTLVTPRTNFATYTFANHFTQPLIHSLEPCLDAHRIGLRTGEVEYGSLALSTYACVYVVHGLSLTNFLADMQFCSQQLTYFGQEAALSILRPCQQFAVSLSQGTLNPSEFAGEAMDGGDGATSARESVRLTLRLILYYLFDELELALAAYSALEKRKHGVATRTHFLFPFRLLYSGLLMFRLARRRDLSGKYRRTALRHLKKIEELANQGAVNAQPMMCLLRAEAQVFATPKTTRSSRQSFDAAVVAAARSGMAHLQALANERAGIHAIQSCSVESATSDGWAGHYLTKAVTLYAEWGAFGKVEKLQKEHGALMEKRNYLLLRRHSMPTGAAAKGRSRFGSFRMTTGDACTITNQPSYLSIERTTLPSSDILSRSSSFSVSD